MKRFLNDSVVFLGMTILVGGLTFGLLDNRVWGATWFQACINIGPCPAAPNAANCPAGAQAGDTCIMCALQIPRATCQFTVANVQCAATAGIGLCGTQTTGICVGPLLACLPIALTGVCNSPGCASGGILP